MYLKTTVIANMKGGVGKTTLVKNLGALIALDHKKRVLLIDLDSSGNLSSFYDAKQDNHGSAGIAAILMDTNASPADNIFHTRFENLDILPANDSLSQAEAKITRDVLLPQQFYLANQLKKIEKNYDICLIDCPPTVNNSILVINALAYADNVLIPITANKDDITGALEFINIVNTVQTYNPKLELKGVIGMRITARSLDKQLVSGAISLPMFRTYIHESVVSQKAGFNNQLFRECSKRANASIDMDNLAAEFVGDPFPHPEHLLK